MELLKQKTYKCKNLFKKLSTRLNTDKEKNNTQDDNKNKSHRMK